MYFKEKEESKPISKYYDGLDDRDKQSLKYLISVLGDISLDREMMSLFLSEFHCFGGKYSVRTKKETIKGIYDFVKEFPSLSSSAIEEIWFIYIDDLFKEYHMKEVLKEYISIYGESEDTIHKFISYVEDKSKILDKKYKEEALLVDELKSEYTDRFIDHIKYLITRKHYHYEDIKKYLPSSELIKLDEDKLLKLAIRTRIMFGCCEPISYSLLESILDDEIESYPEDLYYYVSYGFKEKVCFTKSEYLDSIKKKQLKRK